MTVALGLQTVDISTVDHATAHAIVQAAKDIGFVSISGHALPADLLDSVFATSQAYFAQGEAEKGGREGEYEMSHENRGRSKIYSEKLDEGDTNGKGGDYKEAFNLTFTVLKGEHTQPLPPILRDHTPQLQAFERACQEICQRLCTLFAMGLDLPETTYFASRHNTGLAKSGSILRLLHYPSSSETIRAGAHTDYGSMTLLFQRPGQGGLEVLQDDQWVPVPPSTSETILVNIADQLALWTGGLLKSTRHRVTSAAYAGDRYSIAYFCHPDDSCTLERIPGLGRPDVEAGITAGQHLRNRLAATYV